MNTLLVTVDALRVDHVGWYGYHRDTTPTLDKFAEANTSFSRAFANGTFTSAAIPPILTGSLRKESSDPLTTGKNLHIKHPNVASLLQRAGTTTIALNTNLLLAVWYEQIEGFDRFHEGIPGDPHETEDDESPRSLIKQVGGTIADALGVKPYARRLYDQFRDASDLRMTVYHDAEWVTERVLAETRDLDEDFFLWVHYMDPHEPYGYVDSIAETPYVRDWVADYEPDQLEAIANRAQQYPTEVTSRERQILCDLYDGYVRYFDEALGELFDGLRQQGVWDETQVFITADHGEEFNDHGEYFHHNKPYDELIHVPLLAKSPILESGRREDQVRHIDIAPTILETHGIDTERTSFDGESLARSVGDRPVIVSGCDRPYFDVSSRSHAAIRDDGWKLIANPEGPVELYDLDVDPTEKQNIITEHPDQTQKLWNELSPHITVSETDENVSSDTLDNQEVQNRLHELGYLE